MAEVGEKHGQEQSLGNNKRTSSEMGIVRGKGRKVRPDRQSFDARGRERIAWKGRPQSSSKSTKWLNLKTHRKMAEL